MLRVTLAGLRAHAARFVLTGLVVVLSVGFTAGTLVLSDSLDKAGVDEVAATAKGVDLSVSPAEDATFGAADTDRVAGLESVAAAIPRAETGARGTDADGRVDEGLWLTVTAVPAEETAAGVTLADGRLPRRDDEAVLDATTAERAGATVGDSFAVAPWDTDLVRFTVVGIVATSQTGGPTVGTTFPALTGLAPELGATRIDVLLEPEADPAAVSAALQDATGGSVETGAQLTDRLVDQSVSLANALRVPLLILGAVALIVAAFVIANTFRILVAQRTRDLALLRTVGATRRQVRRGVLVESLMVGVVGSVAGLALGAAGAVLVGTLIASGAALPVVVSTTTVVSSLAIGTVVTVGAAWVPARAATRVPPLAALRAAPDGAGDASTGRVRTTFGTLLILGGAGILALAAAVASTLAALGLVVVVAGATVFFLGVLVLGPVIMPPLVALGGRAARAVAGSRQRATLDLATANVLRHPRRVAATSGALLIGVVVVVGFSVMATSARSAADGWVDETFPADITVSVAGSTDAVIPDEAVAAVEGTPDVQVAVPIRSVHAESPDLPDGWIAVNGVDLDRFVALTDTDQAVPGAGEALLDESGAARNGIEVGDTVTYTGADGADHAVTVVDVTDRAGDGLTVPDEEFRAAFPRIGISDIAVDAADGAEVESVRAAIVDRTSGHTDIAVRNADDARDGAMAQFDRAIGVALAVLGLAVVIAVIGIGNTLSLAVHERTREIGLLRALGLTRRQTRAMLGTEAVVISALAGVLGVVIALAFSWVAVRTLPDLSMTVPWITVVAAVVLAAVLGWVASLLPARRAARTSPVVALAAD